MESKKFKITKSFVDSVPLSHDKQTFYRDSELTGFALRVTGIKTFVAEKKLPSGVPCRVTIGQYGLWTVPQAREQAKEYLLQIAKGINPNREKSARRSQARHEYRNEKSIPTLAMAFEFYKDRKQLSKNTISSYTRCVDDYFIEWKDKQLHLITQKMVIDRHIELSKHSPAQANLAAKFLNALFNHTITRYKDDDGNKILDIKNPVSVVSEEKAFNKIKRRRTYIRAEQQHDWSLAVATIEWIGEQSDNFKAYTNQDYLFLLILTGFRRGEGETVLWENIDLKYGTITVKDTKNGEDLMLPMGDVLWHILRERRKRAINKYVFADRTGKTHISDRRVVRERVTEVSGVKFTLHDLRRTFSSIANSLSIGGYTIKRLINHTFEDDSSDVTDGYVQVSFEDMRKAMNMIERVVISEDVRDIVLKRKYDKC